MDITPAEHVIRLQEVQALERELGTYLQSTLDIAERIQSLSPNRRTALVVTKLEEAQMWNERR